TLQPWVCRWEQAMLNSLLSEKEQSEYFIKFNLDALLRGDKKSRMDSYSVGVQNGIYSPNECRKFEDENPIPAEEGGDSYFVNSQIKSLKKAAFGDENKE
ncbi:MAG: phage portal protein, partial [Oscillospiraceae bacterium]|nr:phage portal protein [Oscillospiraceae bacterium]